MKTPSTCFPTATFFALLLGLLTAMARPDLFPVTTNDYAAATISGGGDSMNPTASKDGRYVLFSSSANNLAVTTSNAAYASSPRSILNVFLRDRTNDTTKLVSVNSMGKAGGNGNSYAVALSTNGQYALFESIASDLVAGDTNNAMDVFLRDLANNTTLLLSVKTRGGCGNTTSWQSDMTPDARYVVFSSTSTDLVPDDTNVISDIFVRDLLARTTTIASAGALRSPGTTSGSDSPAITPDGRFVIFVSSATNLVPNVSTPNEIYVRDLTAATTVCVSAGAHAFFPGSIMSYNHTLSDDGQFVAFESSTDASVASSFGSVFRFELSSSNLENVATNALCVPNSQTGFRHFRSLSLASDGQSIAFVGKTNVASHIYLWNARANSTTVLTRDLSDSLSTNALSDFPQFDDTGSFVAFLTTATNLTTNVVSDGFHLYVRDLQEQTTRLVDANPAGLGSSKDFVNPPQFAAGASLVVFDASDSDLIPGDNNNGYDVFLHDMASGTNELISACDPRFLSQTSAGIGLGSVFATSADGSYVAFAASPAAFLPGCTNRQRSIFVRDLAYGSNMLVSINTNGLAGADGMATDPVISGDGRWIAFASTADNLVPGDTNKLKDVFVRAWMGGPVSLVSVSANGISPGNGASSSPQISADGRLVLFRTKASNLASPSGSLILRNLESGISYAIAPSTVNCETMTPDGRFVAFGGAYGNNMYLWDSQLAARVFTNVTLLLSSIAVSADGNRLAGLSGSRVYVADRSAGTNWVLVPSNSSAVISHARLQFSADGGLLVFTTAEPAVPADTNGLPDVYLYDFQAQATTLISHAFDSPAAAQGSSDSSTISPDGRFIAWRSTAGDLTAGDTNGVADIFLLDRASGITTLLTTGASGTGAANERSSAPFFSPDGRTLFFQSWASDLVPNDFNQAGDLFALRILAPDALPIFSAQIAYAPAGNQLPQLTWPATPGRSYRVQFKNDLGAAAWLDLDCSISIAGGNASATDQTPRQGPRFYRIVAF